MNLISLVNSRLGLPLGVFLANALPERAAHRLARGLAASTARQRQLPVTQAVRSNQAVVRGKRYEDPALDGAVKAVLANAAVGYVDLFRALSGGTEALVRRCEMDDSLVAGFREGAARGKGVIAVSAHMSCFDMLLLTLAARGYRVQALSFADPQGSYRVQNTLRRRFGLDLTPISLPSLRKAVRNLRQGGVVLTGIDRPAAEGEDLLFFGQQARLPVGHARLALATGAQILVGVVQSGGIGQYRAFGAGLIDPRGQDASMDGARYLAQKVLSVIEGYVRKRPEEWLMFFPVWPQAIPVGEGR
jgi:KDO2-lipid IV(A) lauroyltransferase